MTDFIVNVNLMLTRKLSYRKDDCAIRPRAYIWVPRKFSRVPEYAHGYYCRNFSRANLKLIALPIPEIIGGTQKLGSPWIRPRSFSLKFFMGFRSDGPSECIPAKFEVRCFSVYPFLR